MQRILSVPSRAIKSVALGGAASGRRRERFCLNSPATRGASTEETNQTNLIRLVSISDIDDSLEIVKGC
jgi:hypothetical protein